MPAGCSGSGQIFCATVVSVSGVTGSPSDDHHVKSLCACCLSLRRPTWRHSRHRRIRPPGTVGRRFSPDLRGVRVFDSTCGAVRACRQPAARCLQRFANQRLLGACRRRSTRPTSIRHLVHRHNSGVPASVAPCFIWAHPPTGSREHRFIADLHEVCAFPLPVALCVHPASTGRSVLTVTDSRTNAVCRRLSTRDATAYRPSHSSSSPCECLWLFRRPWRRAGSVTGASAHLGAVERRFIAPDLRGVYFSGLRVVLCMLPPDARCTMRFATNFCLPEPLCEADPGRRQVFSSGPSPYDCLPAARRPQTDVRSVVDTALFASRIVTLLAVRLYGHQTTVAYRRRLSNSRAPSESAVRACPEGPSCTSLWPCCFSFLHPATSASCIHGAILVSGRDPSI